MKVLKIEDFLKLDNLAKIRFLQEIISGNARLLETVIRKN